MEIKTSFLHNECRYYIEEYYIGFRKVTPKKGDHYIGHKYAYNTIVFMLDGEVEFSYNQYKGRFKKGEMIFIPQASYMYGTALEDSNMLVHTYDLAAESYCSNCVLSKLKFSTEGLNRTSYNFQPLKMVRSVTEFAELICTYMECDYRCLHLHELKQKELFIIMQYAYTHKQMIEFFYPIIGEDIPFRTKVMKIAHEQLYVEEYAGRLNMSTRNFTRKFKAEFGETVYKWMLKRKIAQIKLKLSTPNASVSEIIHEFRFSDASHFYRFCRVNFGYTANELKHQLKSKDTD